MVIRYFARISSVIHILGVRNHFFFIIARLRLCYPQQILYFSFPVIIAVSRVSSRGWTNFCHFGSNYLDKVRNNLPVMESRPQDILETNLSSDKLCALEVVSF